MNKRIAIFHNALDNIGGAEKVDLLMARELGADVYTTNVDFEKIRKMGFGDLIDANRIRSIGRVPRNAPFRQEAIYFRFKNLDLSRMNYNFYIIAGDWAMVAARKHKPNLWYVYSPVREIWDLYDYTRKNIKFFERPIFDLWVRRHRILNLRNVKFVDKVVSTSKNVQDRVKKYLNRDSEIIYPPIEVNKFSYFGNGDFWLSVNRLTPHKRIEMQMKAFAKMADKKLVIVGSFEKGVKHFERYKKYLDSIKPKNVEILHWVSDEELIKFYSKCKGFLTTSFNEDFGLTPLEAMASGKPVIAPNEGGYRETIVRRMNGVLIDEINEDKIVGAVKEIEKDLDRYEDVCKERAKEFDVGEFLRRIRGEVWGKGIRGELV